jgi:hypothetical protein
MNCAPQTKRGRVSPSPFPLCCRILYVSGCQSLSWLRYLLSAPTCDRKERITLVWVAWFNFSLPPKMDMLLLRNLTDAFWHSVSGDSSRKTRRSRRPAPPTVPSLRRLRRPDLLRSLHICPACWAHLARNVQENRARRVALCHLPESNGFGTTRAPFN